MGARNFASVSSNTARAIVQKVEKQQVSIDTSVDTSVETSVEPSVETSVEVSEQDNVETEMHPPISSSSGGS